MAIFKVTTTAGEIKSINSQEVSRVLDQTSFRAIWVGAADLIGTGARIVSAKDTFLQVQRVSGLALVSKVLYKGVDKILAGDGLISRILDSGSSRVIWFGPGELPGVTSSKIHTEETVQVLCQKLGGLVQVTDAISGLRIAVTTKYITSVRSSGTGAAIQMGGTAGVYGTLVKVKESVSKLKTLGIG